MKRMNLEVRIVTLLLMAGFLLIFTLAAEASSPGDGEGGPGLENDLIVFEGEKRTLDSEELVMNGDIVVEGTLILRDTTIYFNNSYNGEHGIEVAASGDLQILEDSIIRPLGVKHYTFKVFGDGTKDPGTETETKGSGTLTIDHSTIAGVGYQSTNPENTGLYLRTPNVSILDSTFSSNHIALFFDRIQGTEFDESVLDETEYDDTEFDEIEFDDTEFDEIEFDELENMNDAIMIRNSRFEENDGAVFFDGSRGLILQGNEFIDNTHGATVRESRLVIVEDSAFSYNTFALKFDNSSYFVIQNNDFEENQNYAISIQFSTLGTIRENDITETRSDDLRYLGSGIILRGTLKVLVRDNTLNFNEIGIMTFHNNTQLSLVDSDITGGKLGLFMYDEHFPGEYRNIRIRDTTEGGFNAKHVTNQIFSYVSFSNIRGLTLNITASHIGFQFPVFDDPDNMIDGNSAVRLYTTVRVHVLEKSGTILEESEVMIVNEGDMVYATPGFEGTDPVTDSQGFTEYVPVEYLILEDKDTTQCEIEITVRWNGIEKIHTVFGEFEPTMVDRTIRLLLRIPDFTASETDFHVIPSEPEAQEIIPISATVANLGTMGETVKITLYRIPGLIDLDLQKSVWETAGELDLPKAAKLVQTLEFFVKGKDILTIGLEWIPQTPGDYTLLLLIDEEDNILELREDNNAISKQVTVVEGTLDPEDGAIVSLIIPAMLNNSNISSSELTISTILRNEGQLTARIVLWITQFQDNATTMVFNREITIPALRNLVIDIPLDLETGDAIINFTILRQSGSGLMNIIEPFRSIIFHVLEKPIFNFEEDEPVIPGVVVYSSAAGGLAFCFAYITFAESARYRFLLMFVPLYMRMSKKDIIEHYTRGEIIGYIKQNPGESYNNIKRDMEMSNGKLAYHLAVLEKGGFIKSVTDGMYRRYYPKKMKVTVYGRITSVQEELLRRIEETPGISQKDLSKLVNLSTATINYHIRKLTAKGLIESRRTGIFVHYYLNGLTVEEIMANAITAKS